MARLDRLALDPGSDPNGVDKGAALDRMEREPVFNDLHAIAEYDRKKAAAK